MKSKTKDSMSVWLIVFLVGFVVFNLIGNIISTTPIERSGYLVGFLFYNVPLFLGRTVGLNITGGGNSLFFTLISSLFFLFVSMKLYMANAGEELSDFSPRPESAVARTLHFVISFFCLESFAYVVMDAQYYIEKSVLLLVAFLIYAIAGFAMNREDETVYGQKFLCRIVATFGFIIGIAGISNVLWYGNVAKIVVLPSGIAQWMAGFAAQANLSWGSMVVMLLITAAFAAIGALCAVKAFTNEMVIPFTGGAAGVFILGGYWHYSGIRNGYISLRAVAYWVLLLIIVVTWAKASKRKILGFFSGFGAICGVGSFVQALRAFGAPCNAWMEQLSQRLAPMQEKAFAWATALVKDDFIAAVLISVVGIGVFLLLTIPASRAEEKLTIPPRIMVTAAEFFLGAVVIRLMDKSFLPWDLNMACCYVLIVAAAGVVASVLAYAVKLDLRGVIHSVVILLLTAAMGVYFAIFAPIVGFLAFALFVTLSTFGTIASFRHYKTTQQQKDQAFKDAHEALDKLQDMGADSRDVSRARSSLNFHFGKK